MDLDRFDNFRQGILDTLNDAYDTVGGRAGWVGYGEGHDYAVSDGFVPDSDHDETAYLTYFPEES